MWPGTSLLLIRCGGQVGALRAAAPWQDVTSLQNAPREPSKAWAHGLIMGKHDLGKPGFEGFF